MLEGSFYTTDQLLQPAPGQLQARIQLNAAHPILGGHFPGLPVVPGVCMLQIIKELVQQAVGKPLALTQAANIKYLSVLDPLQHPIVAARINFEESTAGIQVTEAVIHFDATSFIKLQHAKYSY
ncbi:3-hydroxyacyl-ACP dehydratase [Hymenobacter saemangeumensis]|uniref:3-hydroxyacyl-ACP dehydratase n=1 Tax=Hymenobacter saemangeumensis TaxID=1084522 RepID=A0ABP8ITM6_9BACT